MDFKDIIVRSWQNTLNHIGPLLLITFVQMILIAITIGILAPVTTAGYINSLMQVVRDDRKPEVGDLFSQMRLFFPLLLFSFLVAFVVVIGFLLAILPGIVAICFIAFAAFYMLPYMVDQRLGLFDALKSSWGTAMKAPVSDQIIVVIIYVAIMSLGSSLWFAFLITQPMATFIMIDAYKSRALGQRSGEPELAEPDHAGEPDAPDKTEDPAEPAKADEPVEPDKSDEPVEPEKTSDTDEPVEKDESDPERPKTE